MEEILLKNGVRMIVEDRTALLTGDLYMVHFIFITVVGLGEKDAELKSFCNSEEARLVRELKRPAVHERDLAEVKTGLKDSFLATNLPYMEKPKFPGRFKAKMLRDFLEAEEKSTRAHG
jgi:hypothetical protein